MKKRMNVTSTCTVVLVHGALTDASIWHQVARRLQNSGHPITAPALPMRGLEQDVAYLVGCLDRIDGPVVLAGHSWAGAVISHPDIAATGRVIALVYVAAFQPDSGESAGELNAKYPGTLLVPENLDVFPNPLGGADLTLKPERFAEAYAADLSPQDATVLAWRTIPSWALVSTNDRSLPPEILRFMAARAGSRIVEVESSHAVPLSQPDVVASVIQEAAAVKAEP
jgi:pimeloyl-ACP methyl ester carboxylesterase